MIRNLKVLGLSLVALVAMSAIAASAAQATSGLDFTEGTSILTAQQTTTLKFKLTASGLTVQCTTADLQGTIPAAKVQEATVTPKYSGCTLGGTAANVDVNGCQYQITGAGEPAFTAQADIVNCETGKKLTITQGTCEITVKEQGPLSHIVFSNPTGQDVKANVTVTGIHYEGDTGCGTNVVGTHTDGDLTGETTVEAFKDEGGNKGVQIGVQAT